MSLLQVLHGSGERRVAPREARLGPGSGRGRSRRFTRSTAAALDRFPDPAVILASRRSADGGIDYVYAYANAVAAAAAGSHPQSLVGLGVRDAPIAGGGPHEGLFADYEEAQRTGVPHVDIDMAVTDASGGPPAVVDHRAVPVGTDLLVTWHDVSDRVTALATAQRKVAAQNALFTCAPAGLAVSDGTGRLTRVNPFLCQLTGYLVDELVGMALPDLLGAPTHAPEDAAARLPARGRVERVERRIRRRDGTEVWVSLSVAALNDGPRHDDGFVVVVEDLSEQKLAEERLRCLSERDPLTGLHNRRFFMSEIERSVARVVRGGGTATAVVLDLDGFKAVNDSHGHAAGDHVLCEIAEALRARVRESDLLARIGGDEFAVLLHATDAGQGRVFVDAVTRAIDVLEVRYEGWPLTVSMSAGIAEYERGMGAETLLRAADLAMYRGKSTARARTVRGSGTGAPAEPVRELTCGRIEQALREGSLRLEAQPIVDLGTGATAQHELLVRLVDGDRLLLPAAFLAVAERHGLVSAIDRWVLARAVALIAPQRARDGVARVDVNLSPSSLADPATALLIAELTEREDVDPQNLVLEISGLDLDPRSGGPGLSPDLQELGCSLALEHFGATSDSFAGLGRLPLDYLKIDGALVARLAQSRADRLAVSAVVAKATELGCRTVAEQIGDGASMTIARELGVHLGQGFHIGRPVPVDLD